MTADDHPPESNWFERRSSRGKFLAGAAALSAGALVSSRMPAAARAAEVGEGLHGVPLRGMYLTSQDRLAEGRFGAMFKRLPAFAPRDELLEGLARTMVEDQAVPDDQNLNTSPHLFAGFTFIGQFIDHDITFDNTPLELQQADPDARVNFRTPRYDLDSVYGRGPAYEPDFYDPGDRDKLLLETNVHGVEDVPRDSQGGAIIPERRNDERYDQQRVGLEKNNAPLGVVKLPHDGDRDDKNRGKAGDDVSRRRHRHEGAVIGEIYRR